MSARAPQAAPQAAKPAATASARGALPSRGMPARVQAVLGAAGTPLSPALRALMAGQLGGDLSGIPARLRAAPARVVAADDPGERLADQAEAASSRRTAGASDFAALTAVRVHTGPLAAAAAGALRSKAFTLDNHLVFGAGAWRPDTAAGRALIAHELTHAAMPGPAGSVWRKVLPDGSADAEAADPTDQAQLAAEANTPAEEPREPSAVANGGPVAPATAGLASPPPVAAAAAAPGAEPQVAAAAPQPAGVAEMATGDLGLIDEELAEHERWGAAAAEVGQAGSEERAGVIAHEAAGGAVKGAKEGIQGGVEATIKMKVAEKLVEKAAIATAVRFGAKAGAFKSVPGVGAVIGGALAAYELAHRDWGKTGNAIAGFGKGADIYEQLANTIESISTVLEVATQVANVIAGILGVIVVVSWIAAVASGGALGPLATLLSSIAIKIGLVSLVIDAVNALVLKELITTFRALHAFASEADPRDVVAQGGAIEQAAGGATGFVTGFAAGVAADKGLHIGASKIAPKAPGHPLPPAAGGEGPHVTAKPPPEGGPPPPSVEAIAPAPKAAPEPPVPAPVEAPAEVTAKPAPKVAEPPATAPKTAKPAVAPEVAAPPPEPAAAAPEAAPPAAAEPPASPTPPEPPAAAGGGDGAGKPKHGPIDERSFADMNDAVGDMDRGAFGDQLQAAEAAANVSPAHAPATDKYGASQHGGLRRALLREGPRPVGAEGQHWTKWEDAKAAGPGQRMRASEINENRSWLQDSPDHQATLLLQDPNGGGTQYFVDRPPPEAQLGLFRDKPDGSLAKAGKPTKKSVTPDFKTEHKLADNLLIPDARAKIQARQAEAGRTNVDPNLVTKWAGAEARWQMEGVPGQGDWGWQPQATAREPIQLALPGGRPELAGPGPAASRPAADPAQLPLDFDKPNPSGQLDLFDQPPSPVAETPVPAASAPAAPSLRPMTFPTAGRGAPRPGPGGPDQAPPEIKSDAPITERVNPPYQPPPATPDEIVSLRNQVIDALAARANAGAFAGLMGEQEKHHAANEKPLAGMAAKTGEAIAATTAHQAAIAHREEANKRKTAEEAKARSKLDDYDSRSGELVAIKWPLKGVQKFTGLAAALPDDPGPIASFKRGMLKMNVDASKFIGKLDQVDKTIASQKADHQAREAAAKADVSTLGQTKDKAGAAGEQLDGAKVATAEVEGANKDRLDQAKTEKQGANKTAAALDLQAKQKQGQADSLAAALKFWAEGHRKARVAAVEQTRTRLESQGWHVTGVSGV